MGTLLTVNASEIGFYINGVKIGSAENGDFSFKRDTRDAFSKDSAGWDESEYGKKSWGFSGTSKFRFDEPNYGPDDIVEAMISGTKVAVKFSTEVTGDWKLSGTALIEDFKLGGNAEETATYSYSLKGTGPLHKLTN
jgi:predicted secreted protein